MIKHPQVYSYVDSAFYFDNVHIFQNSKNSPRLSSEANLQPTPTYKPQPSIPSSNKSHIPSPSESDDDAPPPLPTAPPPAPNWGTFPGSSHEFSDVKIAAPVREDISEFSDVLTQQKFDSLRRKAEFLGVDVTETQEYKKLKEGLSSILKLKLIFFPLCTNLL